MEELSYKVRIAVLWLLGIITFFTYRTLAVSESATEVSVLGNAEFARTLLVMMVFAFLSLMLKNNRWNRLTNIIAGAIFAVLELIMLGDGVTAYPSATFNLMTGATVVFMASVVWFAYRWPNAARTTAGK